MDVATIQMDPVEAQLKLDQYKEALSNRHSQAIEREYDAIVKGYEALAKGTPLINPREAISNAGWRADGRPVLAICRADQKQCRWRIERHSRFWDPITGLSNGKWAPMTWRFEGKKERWDRQRAANLVFYVQDVKTEPPVDPKEGRAMVPIIPASILPERGLDFKKHFILWEVENWDEAPPVDPMLLKPIGGDLYAVIGQWDLTDLERAIIAGTRRIE